MGEWPIPGPRVPLSNIGGYCLTPSIYVWWAYVLCHCFVLCLFLSAPRQQSGLLSEQAKHSPAVVKSAPFSKARAPVFGSGNGNVAAKVCRKQPPSAAVNSKPTISKATDAIRFAPCAPLTLPTPHISTLTLSIPHPSAPLTPPPLTVSPFHPLTLFIPHSHLPPSHPSTLSPSLPPPTISAHGPKPTLHPQVPSKLSSIHIDLTPRPAHSMDELFALVLSWSVDLFLCPQQGVCVRACMCACD